MAQETTTTEARKPVDLDRVRYHARQVEPLFRYAHEFRVSTIDVDRDKVRAGTQLLGEDVWAMADEIEHLRADLAETERQRDNHYREFYATQAELAQRITEVEQLRAERQRVIDSCARTEDGNIRNAHRELDEFWPKLKAVRDPDNRVRTGPDTSPLGRLIESAGVLASYMGTVLAALGDNSRATAHLLIEVEDLRDEQDRWQRQYEEQLAATRQLDDLRMREIGELKRELRGASILLAAIVLGQQGGRLTVPDLHLQVANPDCLVRRDMPGVFGGVDLQYQPGRDAAETKED